MINFIIENAILKEYQGDEEKVVIPENVKIIGYQAFMDCINLRVVELHKDIEEIEDSAFVGYSITCAILGASTVIGAIAGLVSAIPGLLTVGIYAAAHAIVFAGHLVTAAVTGKDLHIGTILGFIPNPRKMWLE